MWRWEIAQKGDDLLRSVREVLFRDWHPIGVNDNPSCSDEYDSYAPTLCRYLRQGADESRLAAHLRQIVTVSMGLTLADDVRERRVARQLLGLLQ